MVVNRDQVEAASFLLIVGSPKCSIPTIDWLLLMLLFKHHFF